MAAYLKRHIGWIISLAVLTAVCIVLIILLLQKTSEYSTVRSDYEKTSAELSAQLEDRDRQIQDLSATVTSLNNENASLSDKLLLNDLVNSRDVIIYDRTLPLDLLETVFTYYKAKDAQDLEAFKSVIVPEDSEFYADIMSSFDAPSGPRYDEIKSITLGMSSTGSAEDVRNASFNGTVFLSVNGYFLYLTRETGRWLVYWWD
jgi:cell division protein FtsB